MYITIFTLIILLFSLIIHEIAHGSMALRLGDYTAKRQGRLTLNPLKHLDPLGSVILPLLLVISYSLSGIRGPIVGWAKPVPVNPFNFRDQKWGGLKVALAGPAANLIIGLVFGLAIRFFNLPEQLSLLFGIIVTYNFLWAIFNLLPIPPLDGSWILFNILPAKAAELEAFLRQYGIIILIGFIFFGLEFLYRAAIFLYFFVAGSSPLN